MFSQKLQDSINDQINAELHSAYIYLSMSAFLEDKTLPGFAHWMKLQYEEEVFHAMKLFDFMNDRGGRVKLQAIEAPAAEFGTPLAVFQKALEHEQYITDRISDLYQLALAEGDYPTQVLLQWFIEEQVEEEKNAGDAVAQLELIGDSGLGILMMDREMAARQAAPAAEPAAA